MRLGRGGDDRQAALARERFWRETEQDICSCLVRPGDLAIDVGANVDDYVRTFVAAGCSCIAFECNPRLARLLADRHRGDDRVVIRDEALSSVSGTAELRIPMRWWEESDGVHSPVLFLLGAIGLGFCRIATAIAGARSAML